MRAAFRWLAPEVTLSRVARWFLYKLCSGEQVVLVKCEPGEKIAVIECETICFLFGENAFFCFRSY